MHDFSSWVIIPSLTMTQPEFELNQVYLVSHLMDNLKPADNSQGEREKEKKKKKKRKADENLLDPPLK